MVENAPQMSHPEFVRISHSAERVKILGWFGMKILDFGAHLPVQPRSRLVLRDVHDVRRYVAMARGESHLHMETPGLRFLPGVREPVPLSPRDQRRLRSAGWHEPPGLGEGRNWRADVEHRTDVDDLAYLAGMALREIHQVQSAADIEYTADPSQAFVDHDGVPPSRYRRTQSTSTQKNP